MAEFNNYAVRHFIGGWAFFSGLALCLLGCCATSLVRRPRIRMLTRIVVLGGIILVAGSAAPFPLWVYAAFFVLVGLTAFRPERKLRPSRTHPLVLSLLVLQSLAMVWVEASYWWAPRIPPGTAGTLFVVGDSISMGADPPGKNWPELLGELAGLKARNYSFGGARVESALSNAARIDQDHALVILEIGGNDLLGGTPIPRFREDLERLLTLVCVSNRPVAMIELPLPPSYNRFGMVQRALAKAHGVTLIPKRYFAKVITTPGATVDGLHLSNTGHALLAQALAELIAQSGGGAKP